MENLYETGYEFNKAKMDAFNAGFKGDEIAANFTSCTATLMQTLFLELPTWHKKTFMYSSFSNAVFNTTRMFMNSTRFLNNCTFTSQ